AFWGVYQFNEKHNQNWIKSNFGFEEDEINYIEQIGPSIVVNEGSDDSFIELYNYATTTSPTSSGFYEEICEDLDIPSYVDYFIAQTYYNNGDWLGEWSNNLKMWKPKTEEGKWRYILIDTDYGFGLKGSVNDNRLHMARYPIAVNPTSDIFAAVLENPKFKNYFINRYADLINTIYLPANVENVMKQFRDSMAFDMVAHFAKWGSDTIGWNARIASMMTFVNQRPAISRNYIKDEFNLTSEVVLTLDAFPAGSGRIEISTITPDIYPWSGVYFNGNPVTITAIPNPGFTFDHWGSSVIPSSDLNQRVTYNFSSDDIVTAYFTGSALPAQLTINEINYNSPEELDAHDWVELYNYGTFSLDISGWKIADEQENHKYTLPTGTVIPAGGYIVIPENAHEFSEVFPNVSNVVGQLGFNLSNGGEEIRIYDYKDSLYQFVIFSDQSPWPIEADGLGYTCELLDPNGDMNNGGNWYRGCYGGSPGAAYSSVLLTPVSISGDSVLCSGNSSQLMASSISAYNYQWSMDQNPIANATLESLSVLQSGEYKVMISVDGCSAESNEITVTEKLQVAKPEVFSSQRCGPGEVMLTASSADSILWFASQSGSVIANGSSFVTPVLTQTTTFYVQAGITCPSKTVEVVAMINDEPCDNQLSIFPNPSLGSDIILSSPKMISGIATLIVSNAEGQIVLENTLTISPEGKSNSINLSSLSSGIYFLTAYQGEEILNAKYVSLK
ncbi:MAG TPA: CotH kinase family protein, partial [Bacteroidia bacterium]|nr:CotH kinase family protein [Bacteroidia bacterium]